MDNQIQFRCVLKDGGIYTPEYVYYLKRAIKKYCSIPFSFLCITDNKEVSSICDIFPLKHNWPGWWSKIELFRDDLPLVPSIYFDLDTIIKGSIDELVRIALEEPFIALRGFNQRFAKPNNPNFASGIMVGKFYLYSSVYNIFINDPKKYMESPRENWMHGDQGFIADIVGVDNIPRLQNFVGEEYIVGKKIIHQLNKIPENSKIIAWSGEPRLHLLEKYTDNSIYSELNLLWRKN